MLASLTHELILVFLGLGLHGLQLFALSRDFLFQVQYTLVQGTHGIILGLEEEALRVHELPICCLLLKEVIVPLEKLVVL